jgi:hypothetical protein
VCVHFKSDKRGKPMELDAVFLYHGSPNSEGNTALRLQKEVSRMMGMTACCYIPLQYPLAYVSLSKAFVTCEACHHQHSCEQNG